MHPLNRVRMICVKSNCKTGASCAVLATALLALAPCASAQSNSQTDLAQTTPAAPSNSPTPPPPHGSANVSEVVVTAERLAQARASIQPQIGASVYNITDQAIQNMPGGENVQLDQIILQAPGVAEDSFGQIHIRGEHDQIQYRLNGVILPEGLSVFGQALDPKLIQSVSLITGANTAWTPPGSSTSQRRAALPMAAR
jgi:outer membrane receptor protein involved in Fe transport